MEESKQKPEPEYCFILGPNERSDENEWAFWGNIASWARCAIVQILAHENNRGWCRCRVVGIDARITGYTNRSEIYVPYSWLIPATCHILESSDYYCVQSHLNGEAEIHPAQ